ncbi:MAG: DNA integrity scanning protein DisA nucleotide-binding domain protein [Candidatus Omnitrophica bacterium]|nr:DNA integrity scanning protein DisA nucleotide-binding domain protein [Candidatus Omnitrophota bacterium]
MTSNVWVEFGLQCAAALFVVFRIAVFFAVERTFFLLAGLAGAALLFLTDFGGLYPAGPRLNALGRYAAYFLTAGIVFYPEVRRIAGRIRRRYPEKQFLERNGPLDEIIKACRILASAKIGALMALKRRDDLAPLVEKSVVIDAKIRHELLLTIFTPPTYLHDGGVILSHDRIVSCSAIFPLTQKADLKKNLGTRHRAALGLSEETDALCLVVSEQTGSISLADRGKLYYDVNADELRPLVEKLLRFKKIRLR